MIELVAVNTAQQFNKTQVGERGGQETVACTVNKLLHAVVKIYTYTLRNDSDKKFFFEPKFKETNWILQLYSNFWLYRFLSGILRASKHFTQSFKQYSHAPNTGQAPDYQIGPFTKLFVSGCHDQCHCPTPFTYFVRQKGYFHPFPLTVGI